MQSSANKLTWSDTILLPTFRTKRAKRTKATRKKRRKARKVKTKVLIMKVMAVKGKYHRAWF